MKKRDVISIVAKPELTDAELLTAMKICEWHPGIIKASTMSVWSEAEQRHVLKPNYWFRRMANRLSGRGSQHRTNLTAQIENDGGGLPRKALGGRQ